MRNTSNQSISAVIAALCLAGTCVAQAQTSDPGAARRQGLGLYLETGQASHHGATTDALTFGVRVPTDVRFFSGRMALSVDAFASLWDADALPGARSRFTQLGLVPMLRWRFDEERSPFFVEGGVGVSYLVDGYRTRNKAFGSRWNFSDHLGVGYSFGERRRHEVGVYVKHVSNGGLDQPNPGETFYMLRYGYAL